MKRVLVACECSGVVREAFAKMGFDAWSCDLKDTEIPGKHVKGDVLSIINDGWDLMIAHPPCTYLTVTGNKWFKFKDGSPNLKRYQDQREALDFVRVLMDAPIDKIAIENPISVISTRIRKPDQIVHPWWFGHRVAKSTCLWLKNLPLLVPTNVVDKGEFKTWVCKRTGRLKRQSMWHYEASLSGRSREERAAIRSRTFQGIADAFAAQWGPVI
jgi:site-specific DNA-cytosine methylase